MTDPSTTKERLWTRDLVLASLANLVLAFVFYLLMTTMALYAVERFSATDSAGGLASSMFVIGAVVARLFAGNLADLVGRRRILVVSMVVFVVASFAYLPVDAAADSLGVLLAVRAVHGVAFGIASTAALSLAQSLIPASRRAEGTGYFTLSTTLATAIGPFLGLLLVHGPGYDVLFVVNGAVAVLGIVFSVLLLRTPDVLPGPDERARLRRFHPRDMLHPDVLPVASFMLVLAVSFAGVLTFLNSYAEDAGLESGASIFFLVYAVVLFGTRLVAGRVQDRRGDNVVVYTALAAFAVGLVLLGLATSDAVLVVAGGFLGMGFGTLMSAMQAIAVGRVPMRRVGVAVSTHFFMVDLGVGLGPILLGVLLDAIGYGDMYLVLAGTVVLSAALYHGVHGRKDRARRRAVATLETPLDRAPVPAQG
ncbi:MFS transporter [Actinotalea sp. JY-7885]|uniref:MFS transporter n=1 Tax=Actinotalea sp. JY-7885 TaxID=2758576 RepID=UPI00165EABF6|nr:MFS transporter [Actinotalea sp. JY-7885]